MKKSSIKIPDKKSRRELIRQNNNFLGAIKSLHQKEVNTFNLMFLMAVKLYGANPNEEIFTNSTFTNDFLEKIKFAHEKKSEIVKKDEEIVEKVEEAEKIK